jgi:hypothetical protein
MYKKSIFPPAGHSYSEWFYSFHIFWLWITIRVSDLHSSGAWYTRGQGFLNLRQSHRQVHFHQGWYMTQQTLAAGRKRNLVFHMFHRNGGRSLYFHSVMWDCMLVCEVTHQTGFMKTVWSGPGESRIHKCKQNYWCHYWMDILWIGTS